MRQLLHSRKYSTALPKSSKFIDELQMNYIPTSAFQRTLLSCGSAAIALFNPHRGDMIACLGEVTGENALQYMQRKMRETPEGNEILQEQPRINSKTVAFDKLSKLPENMLGRVYADFMRDNNITADSRLPVQFIADPDLAYMMQRYREVHDLVHATLFMKTTMLGEMNYIPTSAFQRTLLSCGSAAIALFNPHRGDMIACLGEVTGENALQYMQRKMRETPEGNEILQEQPRINSKTVAFDKLSKLPENMLGRVYADFMRDNNITADSRLPVQFIADPDLAYMMQRYREVHDLVHATLFMKTTMLGEVAVKWVEGIQTKLPMCISGGIWGAARLKPKHRQLYLKCYLPWAIRTGVNSQFLQGIYFEKRWEQDIDDFHREMNIKRLQ